MYQLITNFSNFFIKLFGTIIQYVIGLPLSIFLLFLEGIVRIIRCEHVSENEVKKWLYTWCYPYFLKESSDKKLGGYADIV